MPMTATLTEFQNNGNSRTSSFNAHTIAKPYLIIEKRNALNSNSKVAEFSIKIVRGLNDANGDVLPEKFTMEAIVRTPINHSDQLVLDGVVGTFANIVSETEFANSIATQEWLT